MPELKPPRKLSPGTPLRKGARGPRGTARPPLSPPAHPARSARPLGFRGREAPRCVPGVLSPATRSGDAREAGEGAQLVRRRASRHHAPAAAAPRRGPRVAAAGEYSARSAPPAPGTRFGGKIAPGADSAAQPAAAWDVGRGRAEWRGWGGPGGRRRRIGELNRGDLAAGEGLTRGWDLGREVGRSGRERVREKEEVYSEAS